MSKWRTSTWGDEISLEYGKALRNYDTERGKYRVFGSNGPIGWTDQSLAPGPGVILGRKGAYRGIEFCRDPFFVIDTAYYVLPKAELDMRWLYYAIIYHKLGEIDDGSPIPSTTRAAVYVRELHVPPLAEQQSIAQILGTLDDKIELNRRMNATLESMAKAVFQSWFVDFDPVRAKMDGRMPIAMDDEAAAFPDSFDESELGLIPKGWRVRTLGELGRTITGKTPSGTEAASFGGEVLFLTPTDITDNLIVTNTIRTLSKHGVAELKSYLLPVHSLCVSCIGSQMGKVVLNSRPTVSNQQINSLVPLKEEHICFLLMNLRGRRNELFVLASGGSTMPILNKGQFQQIKVLTPTDSIASIFHARVWPLLQTLISNEVQSCTLATLRNTLLPKLLSGELSVKHAEKLVGEAT